MKQKKSVARPKSREDTEKRLLEAAKVVFTKHGYDRATTRMVAEEADVNLGLISRYFENKHGLLVTMIERESNESSTQDLPYPAQPTLLEECLKYAEERFQYSLTHIELVRVIMVQILVNDEVVNSLNQRDLKVTRKNLKERIKKFFPTSTTDSELSSFISDLDRKVLSVTMASYLVHRLSKKACFEELQGLITHVVESYTKK